MKQRVVLSLKQKWGPWSFKHILTVKATIYFQTPFNALWPVEYMPLFLVHSYGKAYVPALIRPLKALLVFLTKAYVERILGHVII